LTKSHSSPLPYLALAWLHLSENPRYIRDYNACKNRIPEPRILTKNMTKYTSNDMFPEMKKWGLLFPINPKLDAKDLPVMWRPDVLASAIRIMNASKDETDEGFKPRSFLKLSSMKCEITVFKDGAGTSHVRLCSDQIWLQLYCDNTDIISDDFAFHLNFKRLSGMEKRLQTAQDLIALFERRPSRKGLNHGPKSDETYLKNLESYKISAGGGTLRDIAIANEGLRKTKKEWGTGTPIKDRARYARDRGKSLVFGGYKDLLKLP